MLENKETGTDKARGIDTDDLEIEKKERIRDITIDDRKKREKMIKKERNILTGR